MMGNCLSANTALFLITEMARYATDTFLFLSFFNGENN